MIVVQAVVRSEAYRQSITTVGRPSPLFCLGRDILGKHCRSMCVRPVPLVKPPRPQNMFRTNPLTLVMNICYPIHTQDLRRIQKSKHERKQRVKKVVGYIRVSTERQGEEGVSLDEQAHMLRGFCHHRKYDLISIQEDDRSAAGNNDHSFRPGLQEAIRIAEREGASLIVPSADRLARNTNALSQILGYGLRVISVADGRRLGRKSLELLIDRA